MSYLDDHPNEVKNASYYRRHLLKITKERDELKALVAEQYMIGVEQGRNEFRDKLITAEDKLDEALARIKASQEQEPVAWRHYESDYSGNPIGAPFISSLRECKDFPLTCESEGLYTSPVISREPQLLAEIERLKEAPPFYSEELALAMSKIKELTHKLAKKQAVPEGW